MKKVIRMIIYEGSDEWVDRTLLRSLKEGYTNVSVAGVGERGTIKVIDLETIIDNFDSIIPSQNDVVKRDISNT